MPIPKLLLKTFTKQNKGLHFMHLNARSLLSCLDEFRNTVCDSMIDFICVSETWFNGNVSDSFVELSGYDVFRNDRCDRRGGGVAIYVNKNLKVTVVEKSSMQCGIEYLILQLTSDGKPLIVGCVYAPPRVELDDLYSLMRNISCRYNDAVLCGDFNQNLLSGTSVGFRTSIQSIGLHIVSNGNEPTCFKSESSSLLDYFIVTNADRVSFSNQLSCSYSDHDIIFMTYDFEVVCARDTHFQYRDFKHINYDALFSECIHLPWYKIYTSSDINEMIGVFNHNISFLFEKYVPVRTCRIRGKPCPWFNGDVEKLVATRDMLYARWRKNKTTENLNAFKTARNVVTTAARNARKLYIENKLPYNASQRKLWAGLRELGIVEGRKCTNVDINVDELNSAFVQSNISDLSQPIGEHCIDSQSVPNTDRFYFHGVTDLDVSKALMSIKSDAMGLDLINTKFLKIIFPLICSYFTHIVNTALMSSKFPLIWKASKVIPIPKIKNPTCPTDFRPISILSFLSKVVERIMALQITEFVESNSLLFKFQSGFRKHHSTTTALLKVSEDIRVGLDKNEATVLVLLDFSKAFDLVNHNILFEKLYDQFQFSKHAISLVKSYITNRIQCVYLNGKFSNYLPLKCGVPQGSILGPLLFSMYINDLSALTMSCDMHIYADDVQLYSSSPCSQLCDKICDFNRILNDVFDWSRRNKLILNARKTQAIVIYRRNIDTSKLIPLVLNDIVIPYSDTVKNLGVTFNKTLTWDEHVTCLTGRIYGILRQFWLSAKDFPIYLRKKLILSLVMPHFAYCASLYVTNDYCSSHKLNVAFNDCVRFIFNLRRYDHVSRYVVEVLGTTMEEYFNFRKCCLLFNLIISRSPCYLFEVLRFMDSSRTNNLLLPRYNCLQSKRSFFVYTSKLWNRLPRSCKREATLAGFKKRYRLELWNVAS